MLITAAIRTGSTPAPCAPCARAQLMGVATPTPLVVLGLLAIGAGLGLGAGAIAARRAAR